MSRFNEEGNVEDRSKLSSLIGMTISKIEMTNRGYVKIHVYSSKKVAKPESFEMPYDYLFDTDGNRFEDDVTS